MRQVMFPAARLSGACRIFFLLTMSAALYSARGFAETVLVVYTKERQVIVLRDGVETDTFAICAIGYLGPKREQGDCRTPFGVYKIVHFNPHSRFHLSLGINYPNAGDRIRAKLSGVRNPGGDIYIHGACASVGCIAIGNEGIAKLYGIAQRIARVQRSIPVLIFPARDPKYCLVLADQRAEGEEHRSEEDFFRNLYEVQRRFAQGRLVSGRADRNGMYLVD